MSADLEAARNLFAHALAAHVEQSWDAAERDYRAALALAPDRPSIVFNLGRLLLDRERNAEAEQLFRTALALAGGDHEAAYNLGVCVARQGRFAEALGHHERALALKPDLAEAHAGRGSALAKLGRDADALASHARAIELRPDEPAFRAGFAASALTGIAEPSPVVERALAACLAGGNVDYQALGPSSWALLRARLDDFRTPPALERLAADRLLVAALERITVAERAAETFFTAVRRELLQRIGENAAGGGAFEPLAVAMAQQCFRNEYVWDVDDAERALVDTLGRRVRAAVATGTPRAIELAVLGCYEPLHRDAAIRAWCGASAAASGAGIRRVIEMQVIEPAAEAALAAGLKRLGEIRDPVSLAVKAQYEENPYPRWLGLARPDPGPYIGRILREIAPHAPVLVAETESPRVLIAGSGTGRHAIVYAAAYQGARVTAIDLSAASLGYAARKAAELGVANVEFVLGDILDLDAGLGPFDVVSSIGVLHHMRDPFLGLERLTGVLKPGGYLMLGLYSELARRDIVRIRALIAGQGFDSSVEGIRACRRFVKNAPGGEFDALIGEAADFYTTSMVRDLLFHVQEHRFAIPQIGSALVANGFEFLGFTFGDPSAKERYARAYPGDAAMLDLGNWHELETRQPALFRAMYQFWARKRGGR